MVLAALCALPLASLARAGGTTAARSAC